MYSSKSLVRFLIIDDDKDNLFILRAHLKSFGYADIAEAHHGHHAIEYLLANPDVDIILLDRMMPDVDGIELFKTIKQHKQLQHIEIIYQTGKISLDDIKECVAVGSKYLLRKPFRNKELLVLIEQLVDHRLRQQYFSNYQDASSDKVLTREFVLASPAEAVMIASRIGCATNSGPVAEAVYQILHNSIEHGNLNIGYSLKQELLADKTYAAELNRRLALPENSDKRVKIEVQYHQSTLEIIITDTGKGFNPAIYQKIDVHNISEPTGRGIIFARKVFDSIEYNAKGNQVRCVASITV